MTNTLKTIEEHNLDRISHRIVDVKWEPTGIACPNCTGLELQGERQSCRNLRDPEMLRVWCPNCDFQSLVLA